MIMLEHLHSSLRYRLLAYTIPLTLLLSSLVYLAFHFVVKDVATNLARNFAAEKAGFNREKAANIILQEVKLAKVLSTSPSLIAWAMNESDAGLKRQAMDMLENVRTAFRDGSYFFAIDKSGHYYFNNRENAYAGKQLRYTLSPDSPKDAWYYAEKKDGQCHINVNIDAVLKKTNVWINCLIRNGKNIAGIVGTGIDLTEFIHTVVDTEQPGVTNMYINQQGAVQAAPDVESIDLNSLTHAVPTEKSIFNLFDRPQDRTAFADLLQDAKRAPRDVKVMTATIKGVPHVIGISDIQEIGWFNVTVLDLNQLSLGRYFLPFALLIGLGMLLLLLLLVLFLNRMVLSRIHRLDRNVQKVKTGDYSVTRSDTAADEIGRLNETFCSMAAAVRDYTTRLEEKVDKRTAEMEKATLDAQAGREQLNAVINHAMDGIIHINAQGIVQSFNPAAEEMFGYTEQDVVGKNVNMLMPKPEHSQHDGYLKRYLESGKAHILGKECEVSAQRKDGSTFPMSLSVNIMHLKGEPRFIGVIRDITERKQAEETIRKLAHFDSLTGLPNRNMFLDRINQALAQAHRNKSGFSLFFLDLDGFKAVNDTLGHKAGDHVLKLVADRLRTCVRKVDTVARLGGDEFTLILPGTTQQEQAAIVADKIIVALDEPMMIDGREYQYHIGASIGIATHPADGEDVDVLIRSADKAMYAAKNSCKNRYLFCQDGKTGK